MASRQYFYNESLTETTTTSTTYADKASVTFTPDASRDYLIVWCCNINNSNTTGRDVLVRLRDDTAASDLNEINLEMQDTSATAGCYEPAFGLARFQSGGSPSSQTFSVEFRAANSADTVRIRDCALLVLRLETGDVYAESRSISSSTSTSPTNKVTLTFTPASQADYAIWGMAELQADTSSGVGADINDGTTTYGSKGRVAKDLGNWMGYGCLLRPNLTASSKTFNLRFNSGAGGNNADMRNAAIIALRMDGFDFNHYAEDRTRASVSSQIYQTRLTTTVSGATTGRDHIILNAGIGDSSQTTNSFFSRFRENASVLHEYFWESTAANTAVGVAHFNFTVHDAVNQDYDVQYRGESTVVAPGLQDVVIHLLQLEGSDVSGSIATTLDNATAAFTGAVPFSGTIATTLADTTSALAALQTQSGSLATTLADATSAIATLQTQSGTLSTTLDDATADFAGDVSSLNVSGAISTTLDNTTSDVVALQTQTGTLTTTLADFTSGITTLQVFSGTIATVLADSTFFGSGTQTQSGSLTATVADATSAISALQTQAGNLTTTLDDAAMSASGQVPFVGTIDTTLADFTMSAIGDNGSGTPAGSDSTFQLNFRRRR